MSLIAGNLAVVQRLLDAEEMRWGVFGGAAAHLYGDRRPIEDVDLLVCKGQLSGVIRLLQQSGKAVQFDGQRILWRGIKLVDDLSIRAPGRVHLLSLDAPMQARIRRMPLLGAQVAVLAPEDVVVHKLLRGLGPEVGKHDHSDVVGMLKRQSLDLDYLRERAHLTGSEAYLRDRLATFGVQL